jgi:hypothetical protein
MKRYRVMHDEWGYDLVEDPGGSVAQYAEARDALAEKEATIQQLFKDALRKDQLMAELHQELREARDAMAVALEASEIGAYGVAEGSLRGALGLPDPQRPQDIDQKHEPQDDPNDRQGRPGHEA